MVYKGNIKKFFNSIHSINDEILDQYVSRWSPYSLPRRHIMTAPGEIERYIYFVVSGIQKSYYVNNNKQHIIAFAYAPSFSGIPESFFTQKPSRYFLETITKSEFLRISYDSHEQSMSSFREIETLFRKTTENFLDGMIQRHHELMAFDVETRFRHFVKRSPHLLSMISQKDLASYLRIDPTNFSKLINSVRL